MYTQDLSPFNSYQDLRTPKCGLWKGGFLSSFFQSLEVEDDYLIKKIMEILTSIGYL